MQHQLFNFCIFIESDEKKFWILHHHQLYLTSILTLYRNKFYDDTEHSINRLWNNINLNSSKKINQKTIFVYLFKHAKFKQQIHCYIELVIDNIYGI